MSTQCIRVHVVAALCATTVNFTAVCAAERRAETPQPAVGQSESQSAQSVARPEAPTSSGLNPAPTIEVDDPVMRASGKLLKTVDDFRGQKITGSGREELGTIDDFMVDTETGKVVYAVVKSASDNSIRLVQQSSLRASGQGWAAELDREGFNNLEKVTAAQLDATQSTAVPVQSQQLSSAVEQRATSAAPATTPAIGVLPPAADSVTAASTAAAAHPDAVTPATTEPVEVTAAPNKGSSIEPPQRETQLVRAGQLKGKAVRVGDRPLGLIEAIGLDLAAGKAWALFQLAGQPTSADGKYYVPLPRLQFGSAGEPASTSLSPSDFERAQPLTQKSATNGSLQESREESLAQAGGAAAASTRTPVEAANVDRDRANSGQGITATPSGSGSAAKSSSDSSSDAARPQSDSRLRSASASAGNPQDESNAAVAAVRAALQSDSALGTQDIEVQQAGQKVVLRGSVANAELKERAEQVAKKSGGEAVIENSLRIQKR